MNQRDESVIINLGYHRQLTQKQIQKLCGFPSYQTCQRSLRRLKKAKMIPEPTYIDLKGKGKVSPVYHLLKAGSDLFTLRTHSKPRMAQVSFKYTPHIITLNDVIIHLKTNKTIKNDGFIIEYRLGNKLVDAIIKTKEWFAVEVDLSEKDWEKEIQRQYRAYEKAYITGKWPSKLKTIIYYSNRYMKLRSWISKVAKTDIVPIFCPRDPEKVEKAIKLSVKKTVKTNNNLST